jgi:hypothetical protein
VNLDRARTVADAVLFEGYLLYPYRSTSRKNQVRWQFGVLGPPGAAEAGVGEEREMSAQCVLRPAADGARVTLHLRFLQLQTRQAERPTGEPGRFEPVEQLSSTGRTWTTWDEAVEREFELDPGPLNELAGAGRRLPVSVGGGADVEDLFDDDGAPIGRLVRRRWPLEAQLSVSAEPVDGVLRLTIAIENVAPGPVTDKDGAIRTSLIGAHLLLQARGGEFVSLLDPPEDARAAVAGCRQRRWWPVLAGVAGDTDLVLVSPIILYDYPEVAEESAGALFDSAEIDEILTLRIMTLTDEEKAEARATDPRAAEIIDRCDAMSPDVLARLHGVLRDPHAGMVTGMGTVAGMVAAVPDPSEGRLDVRNVDPPTFGTEAEVPWWDPEQDASVHPDVDMVQIAGVPVSRGSLVRVHPSRRADAQDLFFADQIARVSAVHSDVDGNIHVAVVLVDDPAAELHDWYGRYLYFAPEELEPLATPPEASVDPVQREESRS